MGWGFIKDVGQAVGGAVSDGLDTMTDVAKDVGSTVADGAGAAGGYMGQGIGSIGEAVDTATFGAASAALDTVDDYVFDTVSYVPGIDINYDDGQFTVGAGFDGLASIGASLGEHGISSSGEVPGGATNFGLTDEGLQAGVTGGINYGRLPYVDGHVDISPNGDVSIAGEVQGTIPTQAGLLSGELSGGFVRTDQGWGAFVENDGTLVMPNGVTLNGGFDAAYAQNETGSHLSLGMDGSVEYGGMTAGHSVGYERVREGDDVIQGVHAEVRASAYGVEVGAEADYIDIDAGGVQQSGWSGAAAVDAFGARAGVSGQSTDSGDDFVVGDEVGGEHAMVPASTDPVSGPMTGGADAAGEMPADDVVADDAIGAADAPIPVVDDPIAAPEPAAGSEFDQAIEVADDIETSFDDMFDDVQ